MANIKSQIKRNKQNEKAHQRNKAVEVVAAYVRAEVPRGRRLGQPREAGTALRAPPASSTRRQQGRHPQEPGREPQVGDRQALRRAGFGLSFSLLAAPGTRCVPALGVARLRMVWQRAASAGPVANIRPVGAMAPRRVSGRRGRRRSGGSRVPARSRAGRLALDLRVRLGDGVQRAGDAVRVPAAQLLANPVDLPGRRADLGRERVGVRAAGPRPTRPSSRTPLASALLISTGEVPVASAQRSCSSASGSCPSTARSATVKPVASARPR